MDSIASLSLNERRIIVGIDFGTTFSGIAWSESRRADQQSVIEAWPSSVGSHEGMSSVKVPTEIRYTSAGVEWGFQIPPIVPRWQWFKVGLSGNSSAQPLAKPVGDNAPPDQGRSFEDLSVDYLKEIIKHLMYTLEQKLGSAILKSIPLQFVLTVPAIWPDNAKIKTLKAFQKAGAVSKFEILLVSEPEAAAIYALNSLDPQNLVVGDSFVVCDAGGGTVDLISYTITSTSPILKVEEAAAGTGDICGSATLNRKFAAYLLSKLGKQLEEDPEVLAEAMERFDSVIKKRYSPDTSEGWSIPVPGLANNESLGIRRGKINVRAEDLKEIFEPTIDKIIDLIRGQIRATKEKIKAVLLVGGFGQNVFLKERLRGVLGSSIDVLQPVNAWTAVVRGAVLKGLAHTDSDRAVTTVMNRKARKHYGIEIHVDFQEGIHDEGRKFWSDMNNSYRIWEMRWFIKKDDLVAERKPHPISFMTYFAVAKGPPTTYKIEVYHDYNSSTAPKYRNGNTEVLVSLSADLSHLTTAQLAPAIKRMKDGQEYYRMEGAVEATYYSASTKYSLLYSGKRYDTVTAEYA